MKKPSKSNLKSFKLPSFSLCASPPFLRDYHARDCEKILFTMRECPAYFSFYIHRLRKCLSFELNGNCDILYRTLSETFRLRWRIERRKKMLMMAVFRFLKCEWNLFINMFLEGYLSLCVSLSHRKGSILGQM